MIIIERGSLDFKDLNDVPVFKKPETAIEGLVQKTLKDMINHCQSQICRKLFTYELKENLQISEIVKKILEKEGCKNVELRRSEGCGPPWDYTPPHVTISFLNPNYEIHLQNLAHSHVASIEQKLKTSVNLDRVVSYSMMDDIDLANQVKTMLEKKGYEKVVLKRSEGCGPPWDYTPPHVTISFANPIYKTYGLE